MLSFIAKTVVAVMLSAGCLVPIAGAQGHPSYEASIPFAFYAGDTLLPAGTYRITQPSQNLLLIHNAQGVALVYQLVFAKQEPSAAPTGQLTFIQYGSASFLDQFSVPDKSSESHMASSCVRGVMEKRAAKKYADSSNREVALNEIPQK